jgi:hypothetical protein
MAAEKVGGTDSFEEKHPSGAKEVAEKLNDRPVL